MIATARSQIITTRLSATVHALVSSESSTFTGHGIVQNRTFTRFTRQYMSTKHNGPDSRGHRNRQPKSRLGDSEAVKALRKEVLDEVAIPGKYQVYFKPDRRALRKAENTLPLGHSNTPMKGTAGGWRDARSRSQDGPDVATDLGQQSNDSQSNTPSTRGFENVAWRALEQAYARDVLPHPYIHREYLEIKDIKYLSHRKTFQLWYRPNPHGNVTESEIAEAVVKHAPAFRTILARHARSSISSRVTFQFARMSDRRASMSEIWAQLEKEAQEQSGSEPMERSEDEEHTK
ncbi:hypothetical protein B0O80DRAFT_441208 [Mortierella sp. GBAus27b]|nr:hypothetical protein BGX31_001410 [Mortierella sp. GBA43]KAI8358654.1 hypothetical protein B0O80DRAFT_441208 [Mortierella sp. GBAus27b]